MCETLLHRRRQRVGTALWLRARAMHYYCAAAGWAHGHGKREQPNGATERPRRTLSHAACTLSKGEARSAAANRAALGGQCAGKRCAYRVRWRDGRPVGLRVVVGSFGLLPVCGNDRYQTRTRASGTSAAEVCASDRVSQARQSLSRDHVRAPSIPASLSRSMAISLMKTGKLRTMWRSRFAHASPLSPATFPAWRRCVDPPYDVTRARETDQGARERGALGEQKLNSVSASVRRGTPQKRGTSAGGRSYRARATGKGAQCEIR